MSKKVDLSKHFTYNIDGFRKDVIAELGNSPTSIAAKLKNLKIKGLKHVVNACPLANYLEHRGFDYASVDGDFEIELEDGKTVEVEMPQAFHKFAEMFDAGKFPDLDDDPDNDF